MTRRPHHALRTTLGVAALVAIWLVGLHIGGLETGLLFLAPAFVLLVPLLAGRYPGESALAPLLRRPRRAIVRVLHVARRQVRLVPRGGLLVGCSLAGRAPPAA